jgi:hypothetical protein
MLWLIAVDGCTVAARIEQRRAAPSIAKAIAEANVGRCDEM